MRGETTRTWGFDKSKQTIILSWTSCIATTLCKCVQIWSNPAEIHIDEQDVCLNNTVYKSGPAAKAFARPNLLNMLNRSQYHKLSKTRSVLNKCLKKLTSWHLAIIATEVKLWETNCNFCFPLSPTNHGGPQFRNIFLCIFACHEHFQFSLHLLTFLWW